MRARNPPAPATPAGSSGTPLAKKLGIVAGSRVHVTGAPDGYRDWLAPLPADVTFVARLTADVTLVHCFETDRDALTTRLEQLRTTLPPTVPVWVSWPKKRAKVPTTITEDVIRTVALPMGWVDVKVCAVSETWTGLKLVVRTALR